MVRFKGDQRRSCADRSAFLCRHGAGDVLLLGFAGIRFIGIRFIGIRFAGERRVGHLNRFTLAHFYHYIVFFGNKPNTAELYRAVITAETVTLESKVLNSQRGIRETGCIVRSIHPQADIALEALRQRKGLIAIGGDGAVNPLIGIHGKVLVLHTGGSCPESPAIAGNTAQAYAGTGSRKLDIEQNILCGSIQASPSAVQRELGIGLTVFVCIALTDGAVNHDGFLVADAGDPLGSLHGRL